ncbi:MAG TPA: hypothetical protein VNF00_05075 [Candidatus Acidoferrales bacterium]|nr:hypothetical protein [Candidatus Acidoferrales bacterium]
MAQKQTALTAGKVIIIGSAVFLLLFGACFASNSIGAVIILSMVNLGVLVVTIAVAAIVSTRANRRERSTSLNIFEENRPRKDKIDD